MEIRDELNCGRLNRIRENCAFVVFEIEKVAKMIYIYI